MTGAVTTPGAGVAERLAQVRGRIERACTEAGRDAASVTLVAVSKTVPAEVLEPWVLAGQRVFGENKVQEARGKWPALRERHTGTELRLIGPLQSNKVRDAVALFDLVESLDRESLARALARECDKQGRRPPVHVQVNIGDEPQKAGVAWAETEAFVAAARETYGFEVRGLMCIPPAGADPEPFFERLAALAAATGVEHLSMGMSGDYPAAIRHGATEVRVGSALFGERPK